MNIKDYEVPTLFSISTLAELLHTNKATVRSLIRQGIITPDAISRKEKQRFTFEAVESILKQFGLEIICEEDYVDTVPIMTEDCDDNCTDCVFNNSYLVIPS